MPCRAGRGGVGGTEWREAAGWHVHCRRLAVIGMNGPGFSSRRMATSAPPTIREGLSAAFDLYRTRFELLLVDLEEEKDNLERRVIFAIIAGFFFGLGSLTATAFLVSLLWNAMGPWAIGLFALIYLGAATALLLMIRRWNAKRQPLFACTLREFEKDADQFAAILENGRSSRSRFPAPSAHSH